MGIKAHLVHLEGQGDLYAFLVDQQTMDWIESNKQTGRKGQSGWEDLDCPAEIVQRLREENKGEDPYIFVTCGSLDNDRALHAMNATLHVDGKPSPTFYSILDATKYAAEHDIELVGEYDGCIY